MKKTLLCSMMLAVFGGVSATQKSVTPVKDSDPMVLPYNSAELQAGTLDYEHSHLYDLICEGRCNLERKENMIPAVLHMDKIPNFVEVCKSGDNAGEIVFTTPQPMGTVTLPAGHDAYVTITLQKLKSEFEKTDTDPKAAEYVALGVREQGSSDFLRILRRPYDVPAENPDTELQKKNEESVCLRMNGNNVVELVPLLSASNMLTDNYGEIEPQTVAKTWTAISTLNPSDFNFGSVFRVDVACAKNAPNMIWEDTKWTGAVGRSNMSYANGIFVAYGSDSLYWTKNSLDSWQQVGEDYSDCGSLILFFSKKNQQYFMVGQSGKIYTNVDESENRIPNIAGTPSISCGVDLGEKFIVVTHEGHMYSLVDGETYWSGPTSALTSLAASGIGVVHISYGDGVLIATTQNEWISISEDKGYTWSQPEKKLKIFADGFTYGNGMFLAGNVDGELQYSTDKGQTWESGSMGGSLRCVATYGDGAFYAIQRDDPPLRSSGGFINLIK